MRDLGVALGGGDDRKVALAKDINLYARYLFTGDPLTALPSEYLQFLGSYMPGVDLIPDKQSTDTPTDFRVIYTTMVENKLTTVTIYTSDYHILRCQMIADLILSPYFNYEFVSVPSSAAMRASRFWPEKFAMITDFILIKTGKE
jgi:hypothetical protein